MENYINYNYYSSNYGGDVIPQEVFEKFAISASNKVRNRIMNADITGFETQVKDATCKVAEILYNQNLNKQQLVNYSNGTTSFITSEKVGDYSRTFGSASISDLEKLSSNEVVDKEIEDTLEEYLLLTGLLYKGMYVF